MQSIRITTTKIVEGYMFQFLFFIILAFACGSTAYFYQNDLILSYGDAESHLNIAKRVVDSITPGAAQLGGIWLPLPHILLIPFVKFEALYRTGLAGSIVSGASYIIASLYIYKTIFLLMKSKIGAFLGALVFALNPNILFLQSTPMTELPLIAFFMLSTYYFLSFLKSEQRIIKLVLSAAFAFAASLTRYEGWFLVSAQIGILIFYYFYKRKFNKMQAFVILYGTPAFFGIALWFLWDFLILGDPLYFTNSQFSAKSQQQEWQARGELPAHNDITQSFLYYLYTSAENVGLLVFLLSLVGVFTYLLRERTFFSLFVSVLFCVPFIFYVLTLYMGQSVIFIPSLTPETFEWQLFNVRYGVMMIPFAAVFCGFLFSFRHKFITIILFLIFITQLVLFYLGMQRAITIDDGIFGLSRSRQTDAEQWVAENYDGGLVLLDDYARSLSIIKSGLPMENVIYVGNKPYWEESLATPEKHARWVIMQKNDQVWEELNDENTYAQLYTHFEKAYESPEVTIFRRMNN